MKTLTYADRTELVDDRSLLGLVRLVVAVRGLLKERSEPSLISMTSGEGLRCLIVRDLPRVGETIDLTEDEQHFVIVPARLAKELAVGIEHAPDCRNPRGLGDWTGRRCGATLTVCRRDAAH